MAVDIQYTAMFLNLRYVQVPKQQPKEVCYNVPREECQQVPKQVPKEECRQVPKQECKQVPREVQTTECFQVLQYNPINRQQYTRVHIFYLALPKGREPFLALRFLQYSTVHTILGLLVIFKP